MHAHGHKTADAFAVKHNFLGQLQRDMVQRALETPANPGEREVIGGLPARPLASTSTVSLVLMSPSTVMRLKLLATASIQGGLKRFGLDGGVGGQKAKHRGVQGPDARRIGSCRAESCPRPCTCRQSGRSRPPSLNSTAICLGRVSLVMMASTARAALSGEESEMGGGFHDSLADVVHRQRNANPSGRSDQHLLGGNIQRGCGNPGHLRGVAEALPAGAGIGVAGIDDDRPRHAAFHAFNAKLHRRGANLVGRERSGHGRRALRKPSAPGPV